ncbi:uncharacterized protein LOC144661138 isoform X2 [Oculina patagonica]
MAVRENCTSRFISIHVRNPRTHLVHGWPVYTDYEIVVLTNSMIFAKQKTQVRRRFSEFAWLWKHLSRHSSLGLKLPSLPTKRRVFGRFSKEFLEERRNCLQEALASLTRITPVLADSSFHLFIQSSLTVKEMENFISGTDKRDLVEIIDPEGAAEYRGNKDRRCTCHSTGDSGFSGSVQPDDVEETRRIFDDVSNWVASQQNYASSALMGNGWSSGYTYQSLRKSRSSSQLRAFCPGCSDKQSNRRLSLSHNVASVLPGGQLMIAPTGVNNPRDSETNGENSDGVSGDSRPYEGDDETELDLSDYDIVKKEPFIRVRDWLNSQNEKSRTGSRLDSSDDEEETVGACPKDVRTKEYDIISVPCSGQPSNCLSTASMGYHSNEEAGSEVANEDEGDNDSEFTVLHSSIGGLDWKDRDELSSSCDSLHSAALFLTYDVVEMIELRYNNVV